MHVSVVLVQAEAAAVQAASSQVDFLYEPCLQACSPAECTPASPPAARVLVSDAGQSRSFGHSRHSSRTKTGLPLAAILAGADMQVCSPAKRGSAQAACLDALQVLQAFTAAPAATSFEARTAASSAVLGAALPSSSKQPSDVAGAVVAAVARVAAVEFPSIRWSCLSGVSATQRSAGPEQVRASGCTIHENMAAAYWI